ncbi:MAG: hypothetical protein IJZ47_06200 [Oscillospiraceae bacterium]|nr:hypothetical protein [Oscillospiraceae bacterium]
MLFNVFRRKLFGKGFEKILKYVVICTAVFFGLYMAEINVTIAPFIKYLMSGSFTAGVMWHALSSDNSAELYGIAALPFRKHSFTFSYIGAYGLYTIITKSALLIAVILAVSVPDITEIFGMLICTLNGILVTSAVYVMKKHRTLGFIWAITSVAAVFSEYALILLSANLIVATLLLFAASPYNFINSFSATAILKSSQKHSIWKYLFRYMIARKNYLINTAAMWVVGIFFSFLLRESGLDAFLPIGFAILSINTPLCVLISADSSLREAVHFLPSGTKMFRLPYFSFIAVNNIIAYTFYLTSFGLQVGGLEPKNILLAVIFALLSASGSVVMEMKFPLAEWKTESDLWHHPRKYIVPAILMLLAGLICVV